MPTVCRLKDAPVAFCCLPPFAPSFCAPTSNCNGSGQSRRPRAGLLWSHSTWCMAKEALSKTCVGGGHHRDFVKIRGCCSGGRAWGLVPFHQGLCAAGGMREGAAMRVCMRACAPLEKAGRGRRGRWRRGGQKAHLVSAAFMCKAGTQGSALAPSWNRSCRRSQTFQGCCTLEGWLLVPNAAGASALN